MIKGIHHIGLSVVDVNESVNFYCPITTLERVGQQEVVPGSAVKQAAGHDLSDVALLRGPNAYLELLQFEQNGHEIVATPVEGPGFTHVCYQSPATDEIYQQFKQRNSNIVSRGDEPVDLGGYGVRYAYIRDRDRTMFEIEQLDEPNFEGPIWLAHVALVSPELDRLVAFYEAVLEVQPYRRLNKLTGPRADQVTGIDDVSIRAAWFNTGNMVLELWQYTNPATPASSGPRPFEQIGYNKFVFEVSDLDEEYARLSDAGVEFLSAPEKLDSVRQVFAYDPDNNLFGLVEYPVDSPLSLDRMKRIEWM